MKALFMEMIAKAIGSRKAVATVAAAVLNLVVMLFLRFGVTLDDQTKAAIEAGVANITNVVIVYVLGQAGVDVAASLKPKPPEE